MFEETEKGNWHMVDTVMAELLEFIDEDVRHDCDHHHHFIPKDVRDEDMCKRDAMALHGELEKMMKDVQAKDANATEYDLAHVMHTIPELEK